MTEDATLVTVLRHGRVAGRPHVFRGSTDEPLSGAGREQMRRVVGTLGVVDRIAASPLRRCRTVAEELAGARGLSAELLPGMAEMHFGAWEGLAVVEAAALDAAAYAAFRNLADEAAAPGGESFGRFRRRVVAAWEAWLADGRGRRRLLITHAGVMRVLLQHLLGLPAASLYRLALPEAAHFQVSLLPGAEPVLLKLNACADFSSPSSS